MNKQAKYSVGDTVRAYESGRVEIFCILQIDYEESSDTYYYTVTDGYRYDFQIHESDIIEKCR